MFLFLKRIFFSVNSHGTLKALQVKQCFYLDSYDHINHATFHISFYAENQVFIMKEIWTFLLTGNLIIYFHVTLHEVTISTVNSIGWQRMRSQQQPQNSPEWRNLKPTSGVGAPAEAQIRHFQNVSQVYQNSKYSKCILIVITCSKGPRNSYCNFHQCWTIESFVQIQDGIWKGNMNITSPFCIHFANWVSNAEKLTSSENASYMMHKDVNLASLKVNLAPCFHSAFLTPTTKVSAPGQWRTEFCGYAPSVNCRKEVQRHQKTCTLNENDIMLP
jgi:hypothetical protein